MENCPFSKKPCYNEKNIHINQNINGEISEWHCCHECAEQVVPNTSLSGFIAIPIQLIQLASMQNPLLINIQKLETMEKQLAEVRCESCNASLTDIQSVGRFGCSKCYETFKDEIQDLLPQMHSGANKHVGKKPTCNIQTLKEEMIKAIEEERYEDAAKFRDRIKELEKVV